jgi:hypothetical protein
LYWRDEGELTRKVWEWAKKRLTLELINNRLLLATEDRGRTVWHVAAEKDNLEALQKAWELAKGKLTTQELINDMNLATNTQATIRHRQRMLDELS